MIQLGNIAEARGDQVRSMEWKVAAQNTIAREQAKEDNARLEGQAANTYRGRFGKGIVAPTGQAPWHSDPDRLGLALCSFSSDIW